jgi:LacI family transcriptional regulator
MSGKKSIRPTLEDVARASGHSLSTVDRVLNGRRPVRADTAQRIQEAAESIGYHAAGVLRERLRQVRPRRTFGFLLQRPDAAFYVGLAAALQQATESAPAMHGKAIVEYLRGQSPEGVAERIEHLGTKVDALAVVVADHPLVGEAIERLSSRGVPVFALISDLSTPARAGYAGLDNRRLGRTAAWFVAELSPRPGKVAVIVGSPRFQCQELGEISFRSYLREHAPTFELLETIATLESEDYGEERMLELLRRYPDLCGFYVGGGGIEGVLRALRARKPGLRIVGVCNDLTPVTRAGMQAGHLHAVLSHPLPELAAGLVAQMNDALASPGGGLRQLLVPFEVHVPQSV